LELPPPRATPPLKKGLRKAVGSKMTKTKAKATPQPKPKAADESMKRQPLAKHYCFTLNNPTNEEKIELSNLVEADNSITYLAYGIEKATTPHLQGYLESKTKGITSDPFRCYYYPEPRIHFFKL